MIGEQFEVPAKQIWKLFEPPDNLIVRANGPSKLYNSAVANKIAVVSGLSVFLRIENHLGQRIVPFTFPELRRKSCEWTQQ